MIRKITIQNYKSIQEMTLELGRVNVLIGANGAGKSNILEAIAFGAAAVASKLDNEFLASRGIRVTNPTFMKSAFDSKSRQSPICLSIVGDIEDFKLILDNDNKPYSKWLIPMDGNFNYKEKELLLERGREYFRFPKDHILTPEDHARIAFSLVPMQSPLYNFIIYSPENSALRTFEREGQIEPLGVNGEGLLKLLGVINDSNENEIIEDIKGLLYFVGWFEDFEIPSWQQLGERNIKIKDRFTDVNLEMFTQKSANEGFLFLLFYAALFVSEDTPKFFAIDNIDASLNPKLCTRLIQELVKLAKKYDKQVILTTHNPAVLDGLNLDDPEQKLMVVSRNKQGHTKIKTVQKPKPLNSEEPIKLSEAFMNGMIGGLPKSF